MNRENCDERLRLLKNNDQNILYIIVEIPVNCIRYLLNFNIELNVFKIIIL